MIWLYHLGTSPQKLHESFSSWEHEIAEGLLKNPNAARYIIFVSTPLIIQTA